MCVLVVVLLLVASHRARHHVPLLALVTLIHDAHINAGVRVRLRRDRGLVGRSG